MITTVYSIIILFATTLGAFVGLGGGVIIKPLLDLVGHDTVQAVSFISSVSVFAMSISATIKHIRSKTKFEVPTILFISLGAAVGGYAGNHLFELLLIFFGNEKIKGIQGLILGILLVIVLFYLNGNHKSFHVKNRVAILLTGLILGGIASFLGIGGGPINVAFFVLFFSFTIKEAAVYSVATIFFSQFIKLATIYSNNQFAPFDLTILLYLVPIAILGGIVGAFLNKKCDEEVIKRTFTVAVTATALLNLYNGIAGLLIK